MSDHGAIQTIKGLQAKGYSVEVRAHFEPLIEGLRKPSAPKAQASAQPLQNNVFTRCGCYA